MSYLNMLNILIVCSRTYKTCLHYYIVRLCAAILGDVLYNIIHIIIQSHAT